MGYFSVLLGLRRLTDTRFLSIVFNSNTLALGYITIGMLFGGIISFALFMNERVKRNNGNAKSLFVVLSLISLCVAIIELLCHVFGIAEFKQTLIACHIMLGNSTFQLH